MILQLGDGVPCPWKAGGCCWQQSRPKHFCEVKSFLESFDFTAGPNSFSAWTFCEDNFWEGLPPSLRFAGRSPRSSRSSGQTLTLSVVSFPQGQYSIIAGFLRGAAGTLKTKVSVG